MQKKTRIPSHMCVDCRCVKGNLSQFFQENPIEPVIVRRTSLLSSIYIETYRQVYIIKDKMQRVVTNVVKPLQKTLFSHPIYDSLLKSDKNVRTFMESHVFAVWDFMILVKQLQRNLTCMDKVWRPPQDLLTARLINEIVLGEETDENLGGGGYVSHYQLYLKAMKEVGAKTDVVEEFIANISAGKNIHEELQKKHISPHVRKFVTNTISSVERPTPYVASQFFFGREDPIPMMFQKFIDNLEDQNKYVSFKYYLQRHIDVDGDTHGPMAERLLEQLAAKEDKEFKLIEEGAINAIQNRIDFWSGIYQKLEH